MGVENFGGKIAWLAVPAKDTSIVVQALKLQNPIELEDFYSGLEKVEDDYGQVLLTPPIDGWVLVVGWWAAGWRKEPARDEVVNKRLLDTVKGVSAILGECQTFGCHRVNSYANWTWAKEGKLIRAFHYSASSQPELIADFGERTSAEKDFDWDSLGEEWFPEDEDVWNVAGNWSIDPSLLGERKDITGKAVLARVADAKDKKAWWQFW
jgi:hypothetical protein